jgi:hypothetical protein
MMTPRETRRYRRTPSDLLKLGKSGEPELAVHSEAVDGGFLWNDPECIPTGGQP